MFDPLGRLIRKVRGAPAFGGGVRQAGVFRARLLGPDGRPVDEWDLFNAATTAGLNYLLGAGFKGASALSSWYLGLISASGYTAVAAADTMGSHDGWTEFQSYSETSRPAWTPGSASGGALASSSATSFTINATGQIQGIFVVSDNTKGGTSGTLWATAVEGSARNVSASQTLQVFYTNTLTPVS